MGHAERSQSAAPASLTPEDLQQFLELEPHLLHDLLALAHVRTGLFAAEFIAGAADGEALVVQEAADLPDDDDVLALVIAAIAAALDGFELRELLLPITQHVRLHAAELADFADREI